MRVLAIDTATTALVTGVVDTVTGQTTERVLEDTRAHNELLIPTITEDKTGDNRRRKTVHIWLV